MEQGALIMGFRIEDQEALDNLNASRKADRIRLANLLQRLGEYYGATVERRDKEANPGWRGQSIDLTFSLNGVGAKSRLAICTVEIMQSFHGITTIRATLAASAAISLAPSMSPWAISRHGRPHHKATSCPRNSWFGLASRLSAGLSTALNGQAFRPVDEPAAT
jgi:hypothetical protein